MLIILPVGSDLSSAKLAPSGIWTQIVPSLYYVSIVVGGLSFGWKAGLGIACFGGFAHALISHFLLAGPLARLEAELLAFLVVGFAFVEERRRATARLTPKTVPSGPIDFRPDVQQVSEIASEILREIRTPLASIEGAAFILKEDGSELTNPVEFIDIIARECHRVQSVLTEVAACAEMHPLNFEAEEVENILSEAVRLAALEAPDPSISLRTEIAAGLPLVWCDKRQIIGVLVPFITSAIKAIAGGGEILLAADRLSGQARIRLSVLGQTVRAGDPASGRGRFSSDFDQAGGLRLLAARRTLLQHGGTVQMVDAGHLRKLQFITIPLYNG